MKWITWPKSYYHHHNSRIVSAINRERTSKYMTVFSFCVMLAITCIVGWLVTIDVDVPVAKHEAIHKQARDAQEWRMFGFEGGK